MSLLLVMLGGAAGAPARFLVDRAVMRGRSGVMPWGTFAVNVIGSFVLGLVVGAGVPQTWRLLLGTGFCGALTTYSTFSFENVRLLQEGRSEIALANTAASLAATSAAVGAGLLLGSVVAGG
ncbi:MAG: fluoride efflux transporter CrcB [Dermatophilus congolensis]|nr:fluoride efflux transporter CrcB [Dermatophilus congolensis]